MREVHLGIGDGKVVVPVHEQAAAYVFHEFSGMKLDGLDNELDAQGVVDVMFAKGYEALAILIPELPARMPEYAFRGFASREAMEQGQVDRDALRKAPSVPQIREAFQTAIEVSGLEDVFEQAGKVLDFERLRGVLTDKAISVLSSSPSSQQRNGASRSESSGISSQALAGTTL